MKSLVHLFLGMLVTSLLLVTTGCEKFLDNDLQGTLTQEDFPETANDALLATNAIYASLREWAYHSGGYPILDILSDDARKGSNPNDQASNLLPYDNFKHTVTQDGLDRWWSTLYTGVKRANLVIEKVGGITMDDNLKKRYIAEAKFLRALLYFDLVRAWGDVPLITSTNPGNKIPRSPKAQVYDTIFADLTFASSNLPKKSQYPNADLGRATQGASEALLARIYLFLRDYPKAEIHALNVINSLEYSLEPDFLDANGVNGNNGVESILEIGALQAESMESGGNQYANTQGVRGTPNRGWGFNRPSMDLINSFEAGDPRLKGTVINLQDTIDGVIILGDGSTPDVTLDEQNNTIEIECYNRKVWVPGDNTITQWGHHRRLIRYADVLLMAAEALNKNGKPGEALVYLNQVRQRARGGIPGILPDITVTEQTQLNDIIINERRHELAMEGWRFWDLVRTQKAEQILGPLGFITGKHELFPVPQNEIDISQGTITQNPNWN
jgi:hypothetical protein